MIAEVVSVIAGAPVLDDAGRIPPRTVCPFRARCSFASAGACHHEGEAHPVAYSCATARGFALIDRGRARHACGTLTPAGGVVHVEEMARKASR